jgi:hypothetical protein
MKRMFFCGVTLLTLLSACSNEDSQTNEASNMLSVTAINVNDEVKTRAGIETTLNSKTIGLYVTGTGYARSTYSTCAVSAAGVGGTVTTPIYLLGAAHVYGFYPAASAVLSPAVPTAASVVTGLTVLATDAFGATGQTDYMYATPDADVTKTDPAVILTFHHALSKLSFVVNSVGFDGTGSLTQIKLTDKGSGTKFLASAAAGSMSIATGAFTGLTGTNTLTYNGTVTINKTASTTAVASVLAAPVATLPTITLALVIDGTTYSADITSSVTAWEAGKEYIYTVTIANGTLAVTSVTVADWTSGGTGTATM